MADEQEKQVNEPEVVETPQEEPKVEADRPEENFKAELARKNAEIARLRAEREAMTEAKTVKYDPQDITTWSTADLKMLAKTQDANLARYKDQAEELILERKVKEIQAKEYESRRRSEAQQKLEVEYPDALDPTSEMAQKISKVMQEYDLSRTPAGRLVAAKIVAAESKASATKGQNKEADRVARVKGQMVDGDRPKPTEVKNSKERTKEFKEKLMNTKNEAGQVEAIGEFLKERDLHKRFFGR